MSIYRRCSATGREPNKIEERVNYVWDADKTEEALCHAWGVSRESVFKDMLFIKQVFCKLSGRQYLHWVLSHDEGVPKNKVNNVAVEIMRMIGEQYQVIVGTHTNTKNLHSHFLINSVSYVSGKKFSESSKDMICFRNRVNTILKKNGLNECGKIESISEKKLDELDAQSVRCNELQEDTVLPLRVYQMWNHSIFVGQGNAENSQLIMPGMLYELGGQNPRCNTDSSYDQLHFKEVEQSQQTLVRGMVYENEQRTGEAYDEVRRIEKGRVFSGRGEWSEGRFYAPGMLYEVDTNNNKNKKEN